MDSNPKQPVRFRDKLGCQDETWEVWGAVRPPLLENVWWVEMCHGKMLGPFPLAFSLFLWHCRFSCGSTKASGSCLPPGCPLPPSLRGGAVLV